MRGVCARGTTRVSRTPCARLCHQCHACTIRPPAPRAIYTPGMSPGWLGSKDPCAALSPQLPPHLSPGLPRRPAQRYQQAHSEDKAPPLGPTNGIILGTTQKDRMGWGTGVCHPVHQHAPQEQNKDQRSCGETMLPEGSWGRNALRVIISIPFLAPLGSPSVHRPRRGTGRGAKPPLSSSGLDGMCKRTSAKTS